MDIVSAFKYFQSEDTKFKEYVDAKCIEAVNESEDYINKENSNQYTNEELAVFRERLIFKKGFVSGLQFLTNINN